MDFHCSDSRRRRLIDGGIRPCLLPFSLNRLEEEPLLGAVLCCVASAYPYKNFYYFTSEVRIFIT